MIEIGIKIIENARYETKPEIAPTTTLSFIDVKLRQLYLTKIQITNGAIKHIKKIIDKVPIKGNNVIRPIIPPKKILNIQICLSSIKFMFINHTLAQNKT